MKQKNACIAPYNIRRFTIVLKIIVSNCSIHIHVYMKAYYYQRCYSREMKNPEKML